MDKFYIGIDLGGTNIKGALFDRDLNCAVERNIPTEAEKGPEHVLVRMYGMICSMLGEKGLTTGDIACMGIGLPGLMDVEAGISLFAATLVDWENIPVSRWFEDRLKVPVFIDNDVRTNLYGEWHFGAGRGYDNVVLLTLGTGVGSAVVMDGRVLYGATASAGEIGHTVMFPGGRPCKCGSAGCLGCYVSATGMVDTIRGKIESGSYSVVCEWVRGDLSKITAKMISDAYDMGDRTAVETMHETGEILGYGLANTINLFNPEIIIIGGGVAAAGERLLKTARETAGKHALKIAGEKCKITTGLLGNEAGAVGAAVYAKHKLNRTSGF